MPRKKDTPHLRLRVEPTLLARLEKVAERNGRTLTGEITHRLSNSFRADDLIETLQEMSERPGWTVRYGNKVLKKGRWVREGDES
jgi:hypothetical protein